MRTLESISILFVIEQSRVLRFLIYWWEVLCTVYSSYCQVFPTNSLIVERLSPSIIIGAGFLFCCNHSQAQSIFFQSSSYWLIRSTFTQQDHSLDLFWFQKRSCMQIGLLVQYLHTTFIFCCKSFNVEILLCNRALLWR